MNSPHAVALSSSSVTESSTSHIIPIHEPPLRTLSDVRAQVASEMSVRAIGKAEMLDDVRVNVITTSCKTDDVSFLIEVGESIRLKLAMHPHLLAVATTGTPITRESNYLMLCASSSDLLMRADILVRSKFMGRCTVLSLKDLDFIPEYGTIGYSMLEGSMMVAAIKEFGGLTYDLAAVWDILRKSARTPVDPLRAPPWSVGIEERLARARAKIERLTPLQAYEELRVPEVHVPAVLVDIRPAAQRAQYGEIDGAMVIERNVLEWRFDPRCTSRVPIANRYDLRVIVVCNEGYTSSLAAVSLQEIGMLNATDVIGGQQAWKQAGLPLNIPEQIYLDEEREGTVTSVSAT